MPGPALRGGQILLLFCGGTIGSAAFPALVSLPAAALVLLVGLALAAWPATRVWAALPAGVLWFSLHALWFQHQAWPAERAGETRQITGRVVGLPEQRDGRARIIFRSDSEARRNGVPAQLLLRWYRPLEWFRPGERWRLTVVLEPIYGRVNPGLFDYQRYLVARGIGALGSIQSARRLGAPGLIGASDRFRQRFADWLQAESVHLDVAALHRALTVADRTAMSPELSERLRRTGTAHLLSISGLHVGMVAGIAGLLAGLLCTPLLRLRAWPDRRRAMLVAGLVAAFCYALLAGFSLPTVRALVMLLAGFGAMLWRRAIGPGRALLTALTAVLLFDPMAPLAIGFWLSFGAVAVLIWVFSGRARGKGWLRGLLQAQVVLAIGLLPLNIGIFGQWAPTALLANLVAIPLVGFWVLPALLLALGLFALGLPADMMVAVSEQGLLLFLELLEALQRLDPWFAGLTTPAMAAPGLSAIVLAAIGALWLLAPRGWPMRPLGAVLMLPLLWPAMQRPGEGEFELLVPDLADGQSVIVRTRNEVLLYGTGPGDGEARSLVPGTLAPLVRHGGSRRVDRIVVPYAHRDYAGGLADARRQWPEAGILSPGATGERGDARCVAGQAWSVDGVDFRFLHPSGALPDLGGDSSCVLEVRSPAGSVLLTGGIGDAVARRLAATDHLRPVDVLVLPRKGHRASLDSAWLERLSPQLGIATADAFNARSLPHTETRARLAGIGARLATTGQCGALRVRFVLDGSLHIEAERVSAPRFWRRADNCPLE